MKPVEYWVEAHQLIIKRLDRVVLDKIDFTLSPGEFCYITGPAGSGKTTFLKALYGAIPIYSGALRILDYDVRGLTPSSMPYYRRKLGILFQEDILIPEWTVHRNLEFVLEATDWNKAEERRIRIMDVLNQLDISGLQNIRAAQLSGGEKKLVSLARSILNEARLILADEPTGNLDSTSSNRMMQALIGLANAYQTSVILCTHDINLVKRFPARSIECRNGAFIEKDIR